MRSVHNRTQALTYDPDGTLIRAIETAYDVRNRVAQVNQGGSLTQQVVDAVGNLTRGQIRTRWPAQVVSVPITPTMP